MFDTTWTYTSLSFLAAVQCFLFLSIAISLLIYFSYFFRKHKELSVSLLLLIAGIIILGVKNIEHGLPFFVANRSQPFHVFSNFLAGLGSFFITVVVFRLERNNQLLSIGRRTFRKILVLIALIGMALLGEPFLASKALEFYEMLICALLGYLVWTNADRQREVPSVCLKDIGLAWMAVSLVHYLGWNLQAMGFDNSAQIIFSLSIISIFLLAGIIILLDVAFFHINSPGALKRPFTKIVFALQWLILGGLVISAGNFSDNQIRYKYQDLGEHASADLAELSAKVSSWESYIKGLCKVFATSPTVTEELILSDPNFDRINDAVDRFSGALEDGVCYLLNLDGTAIASSNRFKADSFVGKNYSFRDYYKEALKSGSSIQYSKGVTSKVAGVYTSRVVKPAPDAKPLAIAVVKKNIILPLVFGDSSYSTIYDAAGNVLTSSGSAMGGISFDKIMESVVPSYFEQNKSLNCRLIKIQGGYYVIAWDNLHSNKVTLAVFNPAVEFFTYRGIVLAVMVLLLLFINALFVFAKYVIVKANSELERANEFKTILDCTPNCVCVLDKDLNIQKMNGMGIPFLGKRAEDFIGQPFAEIWSPVQKESVRNSLRRVMEGDRMSFDGEYFHPEGFRLNFFVVCGPVFDSLGRVTQIVAVWVDITHMKKIERELTGHLEVEKTLSSITSEFLEFENNSNALYNSLRHILTMTGSDRVMWFENGENPEGRTVVKNMVSVVRPGMLGAGSYAGTPLENYEGIWKTWADKFRKGEAVEAHVDDASMQTDFFREQGMLSMLAIPTLESNRWTGFVRMDKCFVREKWSKEKLQGAKSAVALLQDRITRSRAQKTLELLDAAVHSASEGFIITDAPVTDAPPKITFANPAMCLLSGYRMDELVGKDIREFEGTNYEFFKDLRNLLSVSNTLKLTFKRKNIFGGEYLVECDVHPIRNAQGVVTNYLFTHRDITEQNELQNRASLSNKLESIGQLAAGVAHEINTPAQFISDNLHFLQENWGKLAPELSTVIENTPDTRKKQVTYIANEIPAAIADGLEGLSRITTIVKAMREFSHSGSTKARADINKAIETTITVARNEWKYCAEVKTLLDPTLPAVACYIGDLNQVILNLIVNSAQAIAEKNGSSGVKGHITIRTSQDVSHVVIEVEDDGGGIPDKIKEKVFDPFFTTKDVGKGTGQGLFLAHRVVKERHGGTIGFESKEGVGTTFTIRIPKN